MTNFKYIYLINFVFKKTLVKSHIIFEQSILLTPQKRFIMPIKKAKLGEICNRLEINKKLDRFHIRNKKQINI